jgi:hypothetical protein
MHASQRSSRSHYQRGGARRRVVWRAAARANHGDPMGRKSHGVAVPDLTVHP